MARKFQDSISYPPRGMRRETAASCVGLSPTKFDQLIADGRMPKPARVGGCVIWDRYELDAAFDDLTNDDNKISGWDRVSSDDQRRMTACTPELVRNRLHKLGGPTDYDTDAYEQLLKGEITHFELPPGKHPGGICVYADGEREAIVKSKPMSKLEVQALGGYSRASGHSMDVKGEEVCGRPNDC